MGRRAGGFGLEGWQSAAGQALFPPLCIVDLQCSSWPMADRGSRGADHQPALPSTPLQAVKQGARLTLAMGEQPAAATVQGQDVLQGQLALPTGEMAGAALRDAARQLRIPAGRSRCPEVMA